MLTEVAVFMVAGVAVLGMALPRFNLQIGASRVKSREA